VAGRLTARRVGARGGRTRPAVPAWSRGGARAA